MDLTSNIYEVPLVHFQD